MAKTVTAAEMKERERAANEAGLLYIQMMENAGRAAYAELKRRVPALRRLLIVAGKGNNGGAAACALMGRERERGAFVLALDLPSGVSADSGEVAEGAVQADATVTFDCTKPLHFAKASKPFCGALVCADIGIGKALGERET